jgi:uncharacterized protein (DUF1499 family)
MPRRHVALAAIVAILLQACASEPPDTLGVRNGKLAPCPDSPNCVSTEASDEGHATAPFVLEMPPERAWPLVREAVESLPGTVVVRATDDYLHAESTTPLMRYVDDLELLLQGDRGRIAVRSASRVGWSDMGANRERVWQLRRELAARGVVP